MKRRHITVDLSNFPSIFHSFIKDGTIYDSSSSPEAKVYFLDTGVGAYLKTAPKGSLEQEAQMTAYFHGKGLGPEVLAYEQGERDWLMTRALPGEDLLNEGYLADPKRVCDTAAQLLRQLHDIDCRDCPADRTASYIARAKENYRSGRYDASLFPDNWGYRSVEEAFHTVEQIAPALRSDVLIHGDYCLPNIMMDAWTFSGFIDLGSSGRGDRHIDLFWGIWSLGFNLKTDAYRERFLDAYGREKIQPELLAAIGAFEVFG